MQDACINFGFSRGPYHNFIFCTNFSLSFEEFGQKSLVINLKKLTFPPKVEPPPIVQPRVEPLPVLKPKPRPKLIEKPKLTQEAIPSPIVKPVKIQEPKVEPLEYASSAQGSAFEQARPLRRRHQSAQATKLIK